MWFEDGQGVGKPPSPGSILWLSSLNLPEGQIVAVPPPFGMDLRCPLCATPVVLLVLRLGNSFQKRLEHKYPFFSVS